MEFGERNRECSVKSFDTSLPGGISIRVETARKWKNGRGKGNRKIAGAGEDGKGRRSARVVKEALSGHFVHWSRGWKKSAILEFSGLGLVEKG